MSNLSTLVICAAESIMKQVPVFAVCSDTFRSYQEKKFNYFLDEVKKGTANLNFDTLNEYDILHNAYLTQLALLKIRQNEKIKLLAKLFSSYFNKISVESSKIKEYSNDYEQLLIIIEHISLEEWHILCILYDFELKNEGLKNHNPTDNILVIVNKHWEIFLENIQSNLGVNKSYIEAVLAKLNVTGLYQTIVGTYLGYTGNKGYLTPIFYKLIDYFKDDGTRY